MWRGVKGCLALLFSVTGKCGGGFYFLFGGALIIPGGFWREVLCLFGL